jgi:hypothetical protein
MGAGIATLSMADLEQVGIRGLINPLGDEQSEGWLGGSFFVSRGIKLLSFRRKKFPNAIEKPPPLARSSHL